MAACRGSIRCFYVAKLSWVVWWVMALRNFMLSLLTWFSILIIFYHCSELIVFSSESSLFWAEAVFSSLLRWRALSDPLLLGWLFMCLPRAVLSCSCNFSICMWALFSSIWLFCSLFSTVPLAPAMLWPSLRAAYCTALAFSALSLALSSVWYFCLSSCWIYRCSWAFLFSWISRSISSRLTFSCH